MSDTVYSGSKNPVTIACKKCGFKFEVVASQLVGRKIKGCRICDFKMPIEKRAQIHYSKYFTSSPIDIEKVSVNKRIPFGEMRQRWIKKILFHDGRYTIFCPSCKDGFSVDSLQTNNYCKKCLRNLIINKNTEILKLKEV